MRVNIIIHSVNGNIYLMAKALKKKLEEKALDARIYRIKDEDLHLYAAKDNQANEFYEDIISLPPASIEKLRKADAIVLGCPSIFSLPSAEMVGFLNSTFLLKEKNELEGKIFYGFSSSYNSEEDAQSAVTGMHLWANEMHMDRITEPAMLHVDSPFLAIRPGEEVLHIAEEVAKKIANEI